MSAAIVYDIEAPLKSTIFKTTNQVALTLVVFITISFSKSALKIVYLNMDNIFV